MAEVGNSYVMQIKSVLQTDPGEYTAVATNDIGQAHVTFFVNVLPQHVEYVCCLLFCLVCLSFFLRGASTLHYSVLYDILYKRLRNTLTYLLTYLLTISQKTVPTYLLLPVHQI